MDKAQWLSLCPLRAWRLAQRPRISRPKLALLLDVARNTVGYWERGAHCPRPDQLEIIRQVTGIEPHQWCVWMRQRPQEAVII